MSRSRGARAGRAARPGPHTAAAGARAHMSLGAQDVRSNIPAQRRGRGARRTAARLWGDRAEGAGGSHGGEGKHAGIPRPPMRSTNKQPWAVQEPRPLCTGLDRGGEVKGPAARVRPRYGVVQPVPADMTFQNPGSEFPMLDCPEGPFWGSPGKRALQTIQIGDSGILIWVSAGSSCPTRSLRGRAVCHRPLGENSISPRQELCNRSLNGQTEPYF